MSTLAEIEAAVEQLTRAEQEKLRGYIRARLDSQPRRKLTVEEIDARMEAARGAAIPGVTTDEIMAMTRGEE